MSEQEKADYIVKLSATDDWTVKDGRYNSSDKYTELVSIVSQTLRGEAAALINGNVEGVARAIVSRLAHQHGMRPNG